MVETFFGVTLTSVYRVMAHRDEEDRRPVATKIDLSGESAIPKGGELKYGNMIAITTQLWAYTAGRSRQFENVNISNWGAHSSDIVALFFDEEEAKECFKHKDLVCRDPRWIAQTKAVIEAIGDNHPTFYVCKFGSLNLLQYVA